MVTMIMVAQSFACKVCGRMLPLAKSVLCSFKAQAFCRQGQLCEGNSLGAMAVTLAEQHESLKIHQKFKIWTQSWAKLGPSWTMMGQVGAMLEPTGAKIGKNGSQEAQDRPTWSQDRPR